MSTMYADDLLQIYRELAETNPTFKEALLNEINDGKHNPVITNNENIESICEQITEDHPSANLVR